MDQPHIGYTSWRDPPANTLAAIKLASVQAPSEASLGVATDGGSSMLPAFDSLNQQRSYIDVFNKGREPFEFTATRSAPWITLSQSKGRVEDETRVWVTIDWDKAPGGVNPGSIKITGAGPDETIKLTARKPSNLTRATLTGFVEGAGYVAIDAGHFKLWLTYSPKVIVMGAVTGTAPVELRQVFRRALDVVGVPAHVDEGGEPGASSAAAISFSTLFFAPAMVTSPASRAQPATLIRSIAAC